MTTKMVNPGVDCDITWDTGLMESPDGNSDLFMLYTPIGFGTLGVWKLESCLPGYSFQISEKRCIPERLTLQTNVFLNNNCANDEECIDGTVCDPNNMRCSCPVGMTANLNTLSCIPTSSLLKSLQQKDYNVYSSSKSEPVMTTGKDILSNAFHVQMPPGSSCSNNEICGGGSFCSLPMKLCLCPDDMEDFESQCRIPGRPAALTVGPGELCNKNQVCSRGSVCHPIIPVCICPENTVLQENSCFPVGINNQTKNIWRKSETISTKMIHKFPAIPKFDGEGQAAVGFPCRANIDCITGAFCKGTTNPATCQCLSTHVNINNFCEKVIHPGQSGCHHDIQCSVTYSASKCSAGQCICPNGFIAIGQTCKPGVCMTDGDCKGGSKCQDGWCICPEASMKVVDGNCKKVIVD
ncbi:Uncharacterized protein BM_BM2943 [Brugia malayi]|uniref:Bm2943, isoform g n=1 Tax=Brugia malayi TaxID=6279 RepID=A0A1U7F0N0_BRUMA|nr:Uncharacterized protein BM_BM2943 [Brugia malayi]CDP94371.1 Bm2943, isoform g [Brugia malayi]VIO88878.1 Uncharacterized protein BM_BM2943 [Brugia malayi]